MEVLKQSDLSSDEDDTDVILQPDEVLYNPYFIALPLSKGNLPDDMESTYGERCDMLLVRTPLYLGATWKRRKLRCFYDSIFSRSRTWLRHFKVSARAENDGLGFGARPVALQKSSRRFQ